MHSKAINFCPTTSHLLLQRDQRYYDSMLYVCLKNILYYYVVVPFTTVIECFILCPKFPAPKLSLWFGHFFLPKSQLMESDFLNINSMPDLCCFYTHWHHTCSHLPGYSMYKHFKYHVYYVIQLVVWISTMPSGVCCRKCFSGFWLLISHDNSNIHDGSRTFTSWWWCSWWQVKKYF